MTDRLIFVCACHSLDHQVTFWYDEDDEQLVTEVRLITHKGFFKRLWVGITYAFGYKCRYGNFDQFIFNDNDLIELRKFIDKKH